jgi:ubiquinone/menaquinone biosynthesis C-methylase UbiE
MDLQELKQQQRRIWGGGDYTSLSGWLRPAAQALADACAVSAGQEVLDAAAGDGNFALICAAEGAAVVACDISPGQVERGRARALAEGYEVEWLEADVEEMPFEDGRFDCVGSVFGAFIAPRPEVAASELFRVVRPGGTVGMTAWVPGSFVPRLGEISARYAPQPPDPDAPKSDSWGVEEIARERFEPLAGSIDTEVRTLEMAAGSVDELIEQQFDTPPMAAAREIMPPDLFERYRADVTALVRDVADESGGLRSDYLLTVARKRG